MKAFIVGTGVVPAGRRFTAYSNTVLEPSNGMAAKIMIGRTAACWKDCIQEQCKQHRVQLRKKIIDVWVLVKAELDFQCATCGGLTACWTTIKPRAVYMSPTCAHPYWKCESSKLWQRFSASSRTRPTVWPNTRSTMLEAPGPAALCGVLFQGIPQALLLHPLPPV